VGDFLHILEINKKVFTNIATSLTFSEKKAHTFGWNPKKITDYPLNG
jgi:hypothetical protein